MFIFYIFYFYIIAIFLLYIFILLCCKQKQLKRKIFLFITVNHEGQDLYLDRICIQKK